MINVQESLKLIDAKKTRGKGKIGSPEYIGSSLNESDFDGDEQVNEETDDDPSLQNLEDETIRFRCH